MFRFAIAAVLFATVFATAALAAPASITVRGPDGKPLSGAVVSIDIAGVAPARLRGVYAVEQRDIQFAPRVLIVPVGATVAFPNRDRVRHHVYSFSQPKRFDLKLYGREEARSVTFDKPGVVALGCNIHDAMSGFLIVTATPFVAQTDAAGAVVLDGLPAGRATVRVWHPTIRASGNELRQPVTIAAAGLVTQFAIRR
ncbi:MAG: hypothetical protein JWN21_1808 [Sphingomonas bacterium]|uniref:methylamine utilization protein n=1 Tax=Sphingomonas bacterium TaxID=1895847 RepID=UPI0026329204|nr:methylamine utilization protein [Sphingomonas bacterium]MDB5696265.1 hypothetical protein [Sphingomonas bacterium]